MHIGAEIQDVWGYSPRQKLSRYGNTLRGHVHLGLEEYLETANLDWGNLEATDWEVVDPEAVDLEPVDKDRVKTSISNGSILLEGFQVRVGTAPEPFQRALPHGNPDRCRFYQQKPGISTSQL